MYVSIRIKGHPNPGLWQDYLDGLQIIHEIEASPGCAERFRISLRSMACSKSWLI